MKAKRILALLLAAMMLVSILAGCGSNQSSAPAASNDQDTAAASGEQEPAVSEEAASDDAAPENSQFYGPIYDEWSDMTDEELYELAKEEGAVTVYATSSKMLKVEEDFEDLYPGIDLVIYDMDQDEVLDKCRTEAETGNISGDVLQAKDVNGEVFYDFYEEGYCSAFYPSDICQHIDDQLLRYGYPLYASQSFWYYNTEAFPDGQPVNSWWEIVEKNEDGSQKYRIFTKEIGDETAYMSLFASFIVNADAMAQSYKDTYGTDLEYTYDASDFDFAVPENNAGVEYLWRFSQLKMTFIDDGDELVLAVHNSTADDPALALASAGKITNRDESGYHISWVTNLTPYTALQNCEYMYLVTGCAHPAAARLFIRYITGGADGQSGGLDPFSKEGNWAVRDDIVSDWNPLSLAECGAVEADIQSIYETYLDAQDLWIKWLDENPNM